MKNQYKQVLLIIITDYYQQNTAAAITYCAKQKCNDIYDKNNKECFDGLPPFKTIDNPFYIFKFQGTEETCLTYLSATTESLNKLTTDDDDTSYHPNCSTDNECTKLKSCSKLAFQALREEYKWTILCTNQITVSCTTYSNNNYSQCIYSKINGSYCAWTESISSCHAETCKVQLALITTHNIMVLVDSYQMENVRSEDNAHLLLLLLMRNVSLANVYVQLMELDAQLNQFVVFTILKPLIMTQGQTVTVIGLLHHSCAN